MNTIVLWELAPSVVSGLESTSPFCLKAHRALQLAGLPYERRHVASPAALRRLNAAGQAPVLVVDGQPIADTTAILRWIDAAVPHRLVPDDARLAAACWLWEEFADRSLNNFLVAARWADDRNWPAVRNANFGRAPWFVRTLVAPRIRARVVSSLVARDVIRRGLDATWLEYERTLDHLELSAPAEGFWCGTEGPSVADLGLFGQLRALRTELTPAQAASIAKRPTLDAWIDRVDAATKGHGASSGDASQVRARARAA